MRRVILILILAAVFASPVQAQFMLGSAGNGAANPGWIMALNQVNGAGTLLADPITPGGLSGISLDSSIQMFGSTVPGFGNPSSLVQINPFTGALMSTVGTITDTGGNQISIGDLAFQPGTDVLFGIRSNSDGASLGGRLYTINTSTAVATLVGNTGSGSGGGLGFAPDGTLYQLAHNNSFDFTSLNTLNPNNASRVATIGVGTFFDGLGVRGDGTLFATNGGGDGIYTINPISGAANLLGTTGVGAVSDIAFVVPEPGTLLLFGLGLASAGISRRRKRKA